MSCFINALLQGLFGSRTIRSCLRQVLRATSTTAVDALRAFHALAEASAPAAPAAALPSNADLDVCLALTLDAALTAPLHEPLVPRLFTSSFYHNAQADASEFFLSLLDRAPVTRMLLSFGLAEELECPRCNHRRRLRTERHGLLSLPLIADGIPLLDVQSALDAFLAPELLDADYHFLCEACACSEPPTKQPRVLTVPDVLCVQLKRWANADDVAGLRHAVRPNRQLAFAGRRFQLRGTVLHRGPSVQYGHYLACARHETPDGEWWLYNDTLRRLAADADLDSSTENRSYVLVYDLVVE
jgi:hypothetical protein